MAKCTVNRDNNGSISRVNTPEGNESRLFVSIAKHPMVEDQEVALNIYKNIFTEKADEGSQWTHRLSDGSFTESYKDALEKSEEGANIEIGFFSQDKGFSTVITLPRTTNKDTEKGYINHLVLNGYLKDQKERSGNRYYFSVPGEELLEMDAIANLLQQDAFVYLGTAGVKRYGTLFELSKTRDRLKVVGKNGQVMDMDPNQLDGQTYDELDSKYDGAVDIIAEREYRANQRPYSDEPLSPTAERSEEDLKLRLLSLLNKMGVKILSITEYTKNYKVRNGVDPSVRALADIANQVAAFHQGEIRLDELTEETAHFIVEAMPKDQTADVLRNIHRSDEWGEFSEVYRNIYSDLYQDEQLEEAVRREVLGKIVANAIKNKQTDSPTQRNFFDKALEFVRNFFNTVQSYFKPQYRTELDSYLNDVEQLVYSENVSALNLEQFKNNRFTLYNIPKNPSQARILNSTDKLIRSYEKQLQNLRRAGQVSRTDLSKVRDIRGKIEKAEQGLEEAQQKQAIAGLLSMVNHDLSRLEAGMDAVEKGDYNFLSNEESIVFQNLVNNIGPTLSEIEALTIPMKNKDKEWDKLNNDLAEVGQRIRQFKARESLVDTKSVERLVDEVMEKHNIPESDRAYMMDWMTKAQKDTSWTHATFGQMIHARDGMINLLGVNISSMQNRANIYWQEPTKELQRIMRENGVSASDISKNFWDNGFILNEYDQSRFEEVMDFVFADNLKKAAPDNTEVQALSVDEIMDLKRQRKLPNLTIEEENTLRELKRDQERLFREMPFKQEYYDRLNERYENLSQPTRDFLSDYYADMGNLKQTAFTFVGDRQVLNFQNLSPQQRVDFFEMHKKRNNAKSYTDQNGILKQGLSYQYGPEGDILVDEKGRPVVAIDMENASNEAIVAYEMNQMDSSYEGNTEGAEKALETFYSMLSQVQEEQGREEALKFLEMNAYMGFSNEFWDQLTGSTGIVDSLRQAREENPENWYEVSELINNITEKNHRLKSILRLFQKKNSPSEIDANDMSESARDEVKSLQETLSSLYNDASKYLPQQGEQTTDIGESFANESYIKHIKGLGFDVALEDTYEQALEKMDRESEEARKHMTDNNKSFLASDLRNFDNFIKGESQQLNKRILRVMDNLDTTIEELDDIESRIRVRQGIIRAKLLPYYKRFAPKDFSIYQEALKNSDDVAETLRDARLFQPFLEIQPNHTFFDQEQNDMLNPAYDTQYRGGYVQPKKGTITIPSEYSELRKKFGPTVSFDSKKFFDTFGTVTKNSDGTETPSKNQNIFRVYKAFLQYHFDQLDAMGVSSAHNRFLAPQIRKNNLERLTSFATNPSIDALKNALKDISSFTEDDMAKGETRFGTDVKVIPKMYTQRLEDPEDVSSELFYSTTLMAKEAYLRKARVESWGDIMSIYNKILTRDYADTGKAAEATNTIKMVNSAVDYNMFGIKEVRTLPVSVLGRKFDVAKLARNLLSFIKFRNLGFNVVIPLTSYLTGGIFQKIEVLQRDYLHPRSQKLGTKEFRKLSTGSLKEIGKIDTKEKLTVLGQYFRAFNLNETLENSNYGWLARSMPRLGMFLHTMANFPIYAKTLMGVMHDYRVVDGRILNFNAFKNVNQDLSKQELEEKWKQYERDVFYNYVDVKDGKVVFDKKRLGKKLGKEGSELDTYLSTTTDNVQQYIMRVNEFVDGQLSEDDKVYATRDAMMNYFMTHRGWLSIITSRRFKHRHLNATLGMVEEGSYRSTWNFLGEYLREFNGKNVTAVVRNAKEVWNRGDDVTRRNLKRVMLEMGIVNTFIIIGFMLNKLADDDDNKDVFTLQLSNYLLMRTINEMSSSQLAIAQNYSEIIDSPFVGWQTARDMTDILDVFSDEEVKYGNYRGMTESGRWITKMLPGAKQYHDLQNMNQTKNTYYFYNNKNFKPNALGMLDWKNE